MTKVMNASCFHCQRKNPVYSGSNFVKLRSHGKIGERAKVKMCLLARFWVQCFGETSWSFQSGLLKRDFRVQSFGGDSESSLLARFRVQSFGEIPSPVAFWRDLRVLSFGHDRHQNRTKGSLHLIFIKFL